MKKIISIIMCLFMCVFVLPATSMAAPDAVGLYDSAGADGMVTVTSPNKKYSTTYSTRPYTISGFAVPGSFVSVYVYDSASSVYKPYTENGVQITSTVGASGIFVLPPVALSSGRNAFLVRCEKDGAYQHTVFDINVLSASMFNIRSSLQNIKIN